LGDSRLTSDPFDGGVERVGLGGVHASLWLVSIGSSTGSGPPMAGCSAAPFGTTDRDRPLSRTHPAIPHSRARHDRGQNYSIAPAERLVASPG
jgi:hypothetical protein